MSGLTIGAEIDLLNKKFIKLKEEQNQLLGSIAIIIDQGRLSSEQGSRLIKRFHDITQERRRLNEYLERLIHLYETSL